MFTRHHGPILKVLLWVLVLWVSPVIIWELLAWLSGDELMFTRRLSPILQELLWVLVLWVTPVMWYWFWSRTSTWCKSEMKWCPEPCRDHKICRLPDLLINQINRMMSHWPLMGLLLFVYLIAAGRLGGAWGLPWLFRDDPTSPFDLNGRAFWGAFAITLLLAQAWTSIYISMFSTNFLAQRPKPPGAQAWGSPPTNAGQPECAGRAEAATKPLPATEPYWGEVWADLDYFTPFHLLRFLFACTLPYLVLLLTIAYLPNEAPEGIPYTHPHPWKDLMEYLVGILFGAFAVVVSALVWWWVAWPMKKLASMARSDANGRPAVRRVARCLTTVARGMVDFTTRWFKTKEIEELKVLEGDPKEIARRITAAIWGFVAANVLWTVIMFNRVLPVPMVASVALCVLLGMVVLAYFVWISLRSSVRPWVVITLVLCLTLLNEDAYKYRFPGMEADTRRSLYEPSRRVAWKLMAAETTPYDPLLDSRTVLKNWKSHVGQKWPKQRERPKLVLVAVSGGGYRAGFWTATILDDLDRRGREGGDLEGFSDCVRMITGASGGMVGAAYFVETRAEGEARAREQLIKDTDRDSLTPVVKQFVQRDIPGIFRLGPQELDRGIALEREWKYLNHKAFSDSYEEEKTGRRPSLVVSPMIIENGQRMLVSNLDLGELAEPRSDWWRKFEKHSAREFEPSAREFFKMFPTAQKTFLLQTAIRTSATFPYISPAVSLPTDLPMRLVDAGYYDNYGVNLAVAWAYEHREWIDLHTSGLALVQIRAFPRESKPENQGPGDTIAGHIGSAFAGLTGPLEGVMSARNRTMLYRDEEQLRVLDDYFNSPEIKSKQFETFVFEHEGGTAMNWIIASTSTEKMKEDIEGSDRKIQGEMQRLIEWWNGR